MQYFGRFFVQIVCSTANEQHISRYGWVIYTANDYL